MFKARPLVIWDYNGCLLNDLPHIYQCGVERIFRQFGLEPPTIDQYRNEVEANFMEFYWKYGVPRTETAASLDTIMKEGFREHGGHSMLFDDSVATLSRIKAAGLRQFLVTAFDGRLLHESLSHHGLHDFFVEVHSQVRDKRIACHDILARHCLGPDDAIGVTDTLSDVAAFEAVGIRQFICPRGFHGRDRILAAQPRHSGLTVIERLADLPALIGI